MLFSSLKRMTSPVLTASLNDTSGGGSGSGCSFDDRDGSLSSSWSPGLGPSRVHELSPVRAGLGLGYFLEFLSFVYASNCL